jgi:hypothetical protein
VIPPKNASIYLVLSPPRASSTAFARVLWTNPMISYYLHEPYEDSYFRRSTATGPLWALADPISLREFGDPKRGDGVLVKEISFQADDRMAELVETVTAPIVILIRDPRLTINSRQRVKVRSGTDPEFPLHETGWTSIASQVQYCREVGAPYLIVDATDFRSAPLEVFTRVHRELGLPFDERFLSWRPAPELRLSNHRRSGTDHFFTRVLSTSGIEVPNEPVPQIEDFTEDGGLREHVRWTLEVYERLRADDRFVGRGGAGRDNDSQARMRTG